jgi:hypothetical protein
MYHTHSTFLEKVHNISELKTLKPEELPILAEEIRRFMVQSVSKTGGHLAASLGKVLFSNEYLNNAQRFQSKIKENPGAQKTLDLIEARWA